MTWLYYYYLSICEVSKVYTTQLNRWERAKKTCSYYRPYNLETNCIFTGQCNSLNVLIGLIITCLKNELALHV